LAAIDESLSGDQLQRRGNDHQPDSRSRSGA
jgi:hypothetical protein